MCGNGYGTYGSLVRCRFLAPAPQSFSPGDTAQVVPFELAWRHLLHHKKLFLKSLARSPFDLFRTSGWNLIGRIDQPRPESEAFDRGGV